MSASEIRVQAVDDLASIEALRDEWLALERRTPEATGFQSFNWCFHWARVYADSDPSTYKSKVIVVRAEGRAVWLLPLQIERRFGIRWARCLGQPLTQYSDALAEPSADRTKCSRVAEAEMRGWRDIDTISMLHVRSDAVLIQCRQMGHVISTRKSAPFLRLDEPAVLCRALRMGRTLRRRMEALSRWGDVVLDMQVGADSGARLREALALKAAWMHARGKNRSTILEPIAVRFLQAYAKSQDLAVHRLLVGGRTAAVDVGLLAGRAYRSLLSAYDLDFADGSPGHVLTRLLIERLALYGFHEFDLLAPVEPYKLAISSGSIPLLSLHNSFNLRGHIGRFASLHLRQPWYLFRDFRQGFVRPQAFDPDIA